MKYTYLFLIILFTSILCSAQTGKDTLISPINYIQNRNTPDSINELQSLSIPDSVYIKRLAALPFEFSMTYNPMVRQSIERYTIKIRSKLQVMMGHSEFYFPMFDEVLKTYQLPNELKYIAIIESALNPTIISRAHAVGLWQFMRGTGKENGLTINKYIDERKGITESTHAAALYLKKLYGIYNDWQLVLAAYNCGPGNVNKAIRRAGGKYNFWEIYHYLPRETRRYVPEFIGAAYAFCYYKEHNITPVPTILPMQTDTVLIDKQLHLGQVSAVMGIDITDLRKINPQYQKDLIPATKWRHYSLRMPSDQKLKFMAMKDSIYLYRNAYYQKKNQNQTFNKETTGNSGIITHKVRAGESLSVIAARYKVRVSEIKDWNNILGTKIKQGQKLLVYKSE